MKEREENEFELKINQNHRIGLEIKLFMENILFIQFVIDALIFGKIVTREKEWS